MVGRRVDRLGHPQVFGAGRHLRVFTMIHRGDGEEIIGGLIIGDLMIGDMIRLEFIGGG